MGAACASIMVASMLAHKARLITEPTKYAAIGASVAFVAGHMLASRDFTNLWWTMSATVLFVAMTNTRRAEALRRRGLVLRAEGREQRSTLAPEYVEHDAYVEHPDDTMSTYEAHEATAFEKRGLTPVG